MGKINVVWKSYHEPEAISRGYWDQGLLEDMFKKGDFKHHTDFDKLNYGEGMDRDGAIVIINGRMHVEDVDRINEDIAKLRWCLLMITGDEEALFPWQSIRHPMLRTWVMLPRMNQHNDVSFKLPNGYRPTTHKMLKDIGHQERTVDVFFSGQVNHPRREQCVEAVNSLDQEKYNIVLATSQEFGKEVMDYRKYLTTMASAKIALCPSGIETPDNFRLYEALEAGCVPIVDAFATNNQSSGFWQYLYGSNVPFPIVDYWDKLPVLLPQLLNEWDELSSRVFAWWQHYKRDMYLKILDDVKEIDR